MIRLTRHFLLFTLKYFLMKTKTRDKTKRKRIETKRRRWNMKAFWLPATEFPSLQKEMRRQRYCGCFFSFSFTKRHTASRSNTPTVIASPYLSTLFMNERINEKKKNEGNKRKEHANRLVFFIPAWFRRWPFPASLDSQVCGADKMRKIKEEEEERVEMELNLVKMTPLENSEGVRVGCFLGTKIHATFGLNFVLICILVSLK